MPTSSAPTSDPTTGRPSVLAVVNEHGRYQLAEAMDISAAVEDETLLTTLYLVRKTDPLNEYLMKADFYLTKGRGKKKVEHGFYTREKLANAEAEHRAMLDAVE